MTKKTILLVLALAGIVITIYFMRDSLNLKEFFQFGEFGTSTESATLASPSGQIGPTSNKKGFGKILGETSVK